MFGFFCLEKENVSFWHICSVYTDKCVYGYVIQSVVTM
jgi:hypothetical protein